MRLMGPVVGYALGWRTLKMRENPFEEDASLTPEDPRWIGAWWIGYIVVGLGLTVMALPMFLFPKKLRSNAEANKKDALQLTTIKEISNAMGQFQLSPVPYIISHVV